MSHADELSIRTATDDDWQAISDADSRAFGYHYTEEDLAETKQLVRAEDVILAHDGDHLVGIAMHYRKTITVPGGNQVELPGVSWVSVAATHRRRGILRKLFTKQHHRFVAAGFPLSILTASEGTIYGRFGYGPATTEYQIELDRRFAEFRDTAPGIEGALQVTVAEASKVIPDIHERWHRTHQGAIARTEAEWTSIFTDNETRRFGGSALFYIVHPDGYVTYRTRAKSDGVHMQVRDFFAVTDAAHSALWRVLIGLDLMQTISVTTRADDALRFLLTNPRITQTRSSEDSLWVRIMDVPAALQARTYAHDLEATVQIDDPFLDAGGTFALVIRDGKATCERTEGEPALRISLADLGTLYFGAHRAHTLAAAGRVCTADPELLHRFDLAFLTDHQPFIGTHF